MKFPDYLQTAQTMIDSFHANIEYIKQLSSTNNHFAKRFALESGADKVIDYKTENFEDIIHDYDAAFDTVGGDTYKRSFKVLKKSSGIIVSMLEQPNSELMNQYGIKAAFFLTQNNIKVNLDKTFSLDEAAEALDYQKDAHPKGKIVLTV